MLFKTIRIFISKMPDSWQYEIKRIVYAYKIRKGIFYTEEPEYALMEMIIKPGDWVIDIGANVGHYTKKFSEIVGENGRVFAIEPVPVTFSLLTANAQYFKHENVTLLNVAASNENSIVGINVPVLSDGIQNFYEAHLSTNTQRLKVISIPFDILNLPNPIALIKIDAEGHEFEVLKGMKITIERDHPTLIVETFSEIVIDYLTRFGYESDRLHNSPNMIFRWEKDKHKVF